jgi:hypothetical protein
VSEGNAGIVEQPVGVRRVLVIARFHLDHGGQPLARDQIHDPHLAARAAVLTPAGLSIQRPTDFCEGGAHQGRAGAGRRGDGAARREGAAEIVLLRGGERLVPFGRQRGSAERAVGHELARLHDERFVRPRATR